MIASLRKAVTLLDVFTLEVPEWSLGELSAKAGMPKPTAHHILATLVDAGWVVQDAKTRRYRLGIRLWEKGWLAVNQLGLREVARPSVEALAAKSDESVHVGILDSVDPGYVVYIDKVESSQPVRAYSRIGGRAPAYCVATGKALLAHQPREVIDRVAASLVPFTPRTITSAARLHDELARVRRDGVAINTGEWRETVCGVAAAIRDTAGVVVAAVGISGPAERLRPRTRRAIGPLVREAADRISRDLGFQPGRVAACR
jgi:DNA-binding IclR family transcriptional regulator